MHIEQFREYCLSKTEVEECFPFGPEHLVYKVQGKMFCLTSLDSEQFTFNVKCDPEKAIELREQHSAVLPGFHMNKKHWNTIVVDGTLPNAILQQFVDDSYNLVYKKPKLK